MTINTELNINPRLTKENATENSGQKRNLKHIATSMKFLSQDYSSPLNNQHGRKCSVPGRLCPSPSGTNNRGVHGAAADPDDGVASLLSRPQPSLASLGSDRQSSEATHQSVQYPSGSEALPAGRVECSPPRASSQYATTLSSSC